MKEIEKDKENNKENYLISIVGEQMLDGETDKIEVLTAGNFMKKKDHYYIGYKEYDEDNPETFFNNLIKVEDDTVTINRKGPMRSQLMLQRGRRHQCMYQTVAGDLSIGVLGSGRRRHARRDRVGRAARGGAARLYY